MKNIHSLTEQTGTTAKERIETPKDSILASRHHSKNMECYELFLL